VDGLKAKPVADQELDLAPLLNVGHSGRRKLPTQHHHRSVALRAEPSNLPRWLLEGLTAREADVRKQMPLLLTRLGKVHVVFELFHGFWGGDQ